MAYDRNSELEKRIQSAEVFRKEIEEISAALLHHDIFLIPGYDESQKPRTYTEAGRDNYLLFDAAYNRESNTGLWFDREGADRIRIGARIPVTHGLSYNDLPYDEDPPGSITVSRARTAEAIAADIARRYWAKFTEYRERRLNAMAKKHADMSADRKAREAVRLRYPYTQNGYDKIIHGNSWKLDIDREGAYLLEFRNRSKLPIELVFLLLDTATIYQQIAASESETAESTLFATRAGIQSVLGEALRDENQTLKKE